MKNIFASAAVILGIAAVIAGGTGAFFSDTETSSGNTFAAGAIDLKVDNESYYNGNKCAVDVNDINDNENTVEYVWQGPAVYPVPGTDCSTSFPESDLDDGKVFFDFNDVKPDDEGEDTISLHVNDNDAWACMDITLTSDDDNSSNEPELLTGDLPEDELNIWDGELATALNFVWWADDGDNVLETDEVDTIFTENELPESLDSMTNGGAEAFSVALADSGNNVWGEEGPIPGNETVYIAKAWCLGELTLNPVQAGQGFNPSVATGISCDGVDLANDLQTDGVSLTVAFRTIQARHNPSFECSNDVDTTITIFKEVIGDNVPNVAADFQMLLNGNPEPQDTPIPVSAGSYTVTETGPVDDYFTIFTGDCDASGVINVAEGENAVCTVINRHVPIACEVTVQQYADEVVEVNQGKLKNGGLVQVSRSNTNFALGAPQSLGTPYDNPTVPNSFFSLGFPFVGGPSNTNSGMSDGSASIILSFNNSFIVNGPGNDLKLWEVTGGTSYPDEQVDVYVGDNAAGPWTLVGAGVTRDAELDLDDAVGGPIVQARYVRIDDASNMALFEATADGFDLDAVQALNCAPRAIN